jgi:heme/copper-type cytochrome/quinol oxidase subunit 2
MDDTSLMKNLSPEWVDLFIVLAAIFLLVLGIFFWALFLRKRKGARRRIRRRHHHEHRTANPTLAQTGGLPPVREEANPTQTPQP